MADGGAERTRLATRERADLPRLVAANRSGGVEGQSWPYVAFGAALTATGVLAFVYGAVRYRELDAALHEGREPARHDGALLVLATIGVAAGIASILLVLIAP